MLLLKAAVPKLYYVRALGLCRDPNSGTIISRKPDQPQNVRPDSRRHLGRAALHALADLHPDPEAVQVVAAFHSTFFSSW